PPPPAPPPPPLRCGVVGRRHRRGRGHGWRRFDIDASDRLQCDVGDGGRISRRAGPLAHTLVGTMSEFFKALEQAERDRLRQEHADATPADATPAPPQSSPEPEPRPGKASEPTPTVPTEVDRPIPQRPSPPPLLPSASPAPMFRHSLRGRQPKGFAQLKGFVQRVAGRAPVLVTQIDPGSIAADAYRTVRANIELMSEDGPLRRIIITSAAGGDGKSTSA